MFNDDHKMFLIGQTTDFMVHPGCNVGSYERNQPCNHGGLVTFVSASLVPTIKGSLSNPQSRLYPHRVCNNCFKCVIVQHIMIAPMNFLTINIIILV